MKRKFITTDNFNRPPLIPTAILFLLLYTLRLGSWWWVGAAFLAIFLWVQYAVRISREVDAVLKLQVLERKMELLWSDMPEDKRALLKKQIDEMLKAEGWLEDPERKG